MPRFAGDAQAYAAHMISPAAVISLCDDIVQRTMISSHCSDCGIFPLVNQVWVSHHLLKRHCGCGNRPNDVIARSNNGFDVAIP